MTPPRPPFVLFLAALVPLTAALAVTIACAPEAPSEMSDDATAATPATAEAPDAEYVEAIEAWRAERRDGLTQEDSWLSLAGLFWIDDGQTATLGSAEGSDFRFPDKAPAAIGTLRRADGRLQLALEPGVEVTHEGQPVGDAVELRPDVSGEMNQLELGSFVFYAIQRGDKVGIRLKDRESPQLQEFEGLDYYPLDTRWVVDARLEPHPESAEPKTIAIPNVLGQINHEPSPGTLVFTADGREHRLEPIGEPGTELFIVFGDRTNGRGTYGGGRFLYADAPDADGRVTIDFNRSYNPPCAFSPYATCPLPPPGNKLALAVEAGEKGYAGAGH